MIDGFAEERIDQKMAQLVLNDYFISLKNGDTAQILSLLTGPVLEKRERLLRYNPTYGSFLKEKYENVQFLIHGYRFISDFEIFFDIQVILNDQSSLEKEFMIVQEGGVTKIYSEEEKIEYFFR